MGMRFFSLIAGATALVLTTAPAGAVTSFFDDFSTYGTTETFGIVGLSGRPASNVTGGTANDDVFFNNVWSINGNRASVDFLTGTGAIGQNVCPTANCIDLDGSTGDAARMTTTAVFDPGTYRITVGLFGRDPLGLAPDRAATVANDRVKIAFGKNDTATGEVETLVFQRGNITANEDLSGVFFATISQAGTLSITGFETDPRDNIGAILTFIEVTAIPLPAAAPLLAGALGLFGWLGLRRRRATV